MSSADEDLKSLKSCLDFVSNVLEVNCEKEFLAGMNQHNTLTLSNLHLAKKDDPS